MFGLYECAQYMIIVLAGRGSSPSFVKQLWQMQLEEEAEEMFTSTPASYYDEHWNIDNKMLREEKVKKAQSYKRKNQDHPAFRK